jgi:hypothetical protein
MNDAGVTGRRLARLAEAERMAREILGSPREIEPGVRDDRRHYGALAALVRIMELRDRVLDGDVLDGDE